LLVKWQGADSIGMKKIGAYFKLNRDYDQFLLGTAPFLFAVAAVLCGNQRLCKAWLIKELKALIDDEQDAGVLPAYTLPARLWLLHISASTMRNFSVQDYHRGEHDIQDIYRWTNWSLTQTRVPHSLLESPPAYIDFDEQGVDDWPIGKLSGTRRLIDMPEWTDLNSGYFPENDRSDWSTGSSALYWPDRFALAGSILLEDSWIAWPTNDLVRVIHGEPFPMEAQSQVVVGAEFLQGLPRDRGGDGSGSGLIDGDVLAGEDTERSEEKRGVNRHS
jgi:hypothetical protein